MKEPHVRVGILTKPEITFRLNGNFMLKQLGVTYKGDHQITLKASEFLLDGIAVPLNTLTFEPYDQESVSFDLLRVTIGIDFHWEREEDQRFNGALHFIKEDAKITAINILPVENYLESVISSEMSATSSLELLKAHAVISRSWLLAQMEKEQRLKTNAQSYCSMQEAQDEFIRWYDREDHASFDVCADDHCQRYQGITRQTSSLVQQAIHETHGLILTSEGTICDTRFSKCCGGISETFENVWEPVIHTYLQPVTDCSHQAVPPVPDLRFENHADQWIRTSPDAFCNTDNKKVLAQVLNDYDQETADFYRWKVEYKQAELSDLIVRKTGCNFGQIIDLVPVERGVSGRLIQLKIVGTEKTLTIGKELEIRKTLSESHLYSSAFVTDRFDFNDEIPGRFVLTGAGWGHGVGLCQIGAAMMGEKGYRFDDILLHYYRGAQLTKEY